MIIQVYPYTSHLCHVESVCNRLNILVSVRITCSAAVFAAFLKHRYSERLRLYLTPWLPQKFPLYVYLFLDGNKSEYSIDIEKMIIFVLIAVVEANAHIFQFWLDILSQPPQLFKIGENFFLV